MLIAALIVFIIVLGLFQIFARLRPNSFVWTIANYVWVSIATLGVLTAVQEANIQSLSMYKEFQYRVVESVREIARHEAEARIYRYHLKIREHNLTSDQKVTYQDGIRWFEAASRALSDVINSRDWTRYLPDGVEFKDFQIPKPDLAHSIWVAEDKQQFSKSVAAIQREFDKLHESNSNVSYTTFIYILKAIMPLLLAIAGALKLSNITAKSKGSFQSKDIG